MKSNIIKGFIALSITFAFASCENDGYDKYDAGKTPSVEMNGEWFIDGSNADDGLLFQHAKHVTYDTNAGDNKMYITDNSTGWVLKGKVTVDPKTLTFSTTAEDNLLDAGTFTITEGKILKGAAHSQAGNVTDSIYFKGEFSYDAGYIIIFSGHKRTGFLEDEY